MSTIPSPHARCAAWTSSLEIGPCAWLPPWPAMFLLCAQPAAVDRTAAKATIEICFNMDLSSSLGAAIIALAGCPGEYHGSSAVCLRMNSATHRQTVENLATDCQIYGSTHIGQKNGEIWEMSCEPCTPLASDDENIMDTSKNASPSKATTRHEDGRRNRDRPSCDGTPLTRPSHRFQS